MAPFLFLKTGLSLYHKTHILKLEQLVSLFLYVLSHLAGIIQILEKNFPKLV